MSEIETVFENILKRKHVPFQRQATRLYHIQVKGTQVTISLDNIEKDFIQSRSKSVVERFAATVLQEIYFPEEWDSLQAGIFFALVPTGTKGLEDTDYTEPISKNVLKVLSYYDPIKKWVIWVPKGTLRDLDISRQSASKAALHNLEKIMDKTKITFLDAGNDHKLGVIEAQSPYKAAMLLTKTLKKKLANHLGWPLYAIAPTRDFVYLFSVQSGLVDKVGHVTVEEYKKSSHPLSTEVWKLSEKGIQSIGEFPNQ